MRQVPEHIVQRLQRLRELPDDGWQGTDVADARKLLGLSQAELAERIGYSRGGVAKVEAAAVVEVVVVLALRWLLHAVELE